MNKPLPWNVKGVGFDAREAARIAAKRAGVPLGDWLNGVISARAAELGVQVDDVEPDDRLEAIAARLSQDETPGLEVFARQVPTGERDREAAIGEDPAGGNVLDLARPQPQRRTALPPRAEARLPAFGRPVRSVEPPLAELASLPKAPANARFVSSALAGRAAPQTGRNGTAEATEDSSASASLDKPGAVPSKKTQIEAAELDARLASILERLDRSFGIAERLGAPAGAEGAERGATAGTAATLERNEPKAKAAVGSSDRTAAVQKTNMGAPTPSDDFSDLHAAFKDLAQRLDGQASVPQATEASAAATDLAAEIAALGRRVDRLCHGPALDRGTKRSREVQALRREMEQLSASLSRLSPQQSLQSLEKAVRELAGRVDLSRLDGVQASVLAPVERLSREVREAIRAVDAAPAVEALRRDMAAMSARIERLQQRDMDPKAIEVLRHDMREIREAIATLTERLGAAEQLQGEVMALGDRVGAIAERTSPTAVRDLVAAVGEIRTLLRGFADVGGLGALDQKIDTLSARVETMATTRQPAAFLDDLAEQIDRAHDGLFERLAPLNGRSELAALHDRIGALSGKIDAVSRSSHDVNALYGLVGSLADRLEEARNPQGDGETLNALQAQMGQLVERLDRTGTTDSTLQGLERLIGDLFLQIEQSRNVAIDAAENAARAAAQDTLRAAMDNPALNGAELTVQTGLDVDHVSQELAELRRVQEASDRRVNTTLTALNTTLERLVDRLVADQEVRPEDGAASAAKATRRRGRTPPEPTVGDVEPRDALAAFDPEQFLLEPGGYDAKGRSQAGAAFDSVGTSGPRVSGANLATEVGPLIAAARRAAQAAQASALEASLKADAPAETATTSAGKTRSFFASKRRALLLGLAGVVLLAGTLQIVRLSTTRDGDAGSAASEPNADTAVPSESKATTLDSRPAPEAASPQGDATPAKPAAAAPSTGGGASLLAPPATEDKPTAGFVPPPSSPAASNAQASPTLAASLPAGLSQPLRDLAGRGDAAAQYEVAARLSDGRGVARDPRQAMAWFQRAAQQGFAPAQYRLGSVYEKGVGVAADSALAVAWYEKAAGQGNVRAMHNLAVMSAEGTGSKPDYGKAVTWFTKAASYGVRDSQFNLAVLFARGLGVPQSLGQSYAWFAVAAQQGDGDAVAKRDTVAAKLDAKALADAKATVASFHPLAPDAAANEVTPPPGGWDAPQSARTAGKTEARVSSM